MRRASSASPPREVLWDYIKGRVEKAGVREHIRFNTAVRNISYDEASTLFTITVHDHNTDTLYSETFDYVVTASGHFSTPKVPYFEGFETFGGRILHAHDFRDALEFKDKDILLVGSSYSAEDIGSQCYKYGAKSITTSYRTAPMGYKWPDNWKEKPLLEKVDVDTAYFADGSIQKIDAIILCTGYLHHFPFMPEALRLKSDNRLWPLDLYKGVVWEDNPKMFYLGMQDQWYTFNMFDAQAWYVRDIIMGKITLPETKEEMTANSMEWRERELELNTAEEMFTFQGDYILELIEATDYPTFDIEGVRKTFLEWKHHKKDDIMAFRNHSYRSLMTGTMSPTHHTPWLDALDDSLEAYLCDESETKKAS